MEGKQVCAQVWLVFHTTTEAAVVKVRSPQGETCLNPKPTRGWVASESGDTLRGWQRPPPSVSVTHTHTQNQVAPKPQRGEVSSSNSTTYTSDSYQLAAGASRSEIVCVWGGLRDKEGNEERRDCFLNQDSGGRGG